MHVEQFCWRYHKDFFTQHQFPFVEGLTPAELRMGSFPCPLQRHQQLRLGGGACRPARRARTEPRARVTAWSWVSSSTARAACGRGWPVTSPISTAAWTTSTTCSSPAQPSRWLRALSASFTATGMRPGYVTQRFAEAHVHPPIPDDRYPWVQYNSWKYGKEIDEAQQLAVLGTLRRAGHGSGRARPGLVARHRRLARRPHQVPARPQADRRSRP